MDAIEVALRKCLHILVSSNTITERKRNVENFIELLKDNRIHDLLDNECDNDNSSKTSITWNEMFNVIREYTMNELASLRTKSNKSMASDLKYQESLRLFKVFIENVNINGPQLDSRRLVESILSIITSETWSSCSIVIKELSYLFINHVFCYHKYVNELREQEWNDLCVLYMTLSNTKDRTLNDSDQTLYSSYLRIIIEKLVNYNDLDTTGDSCRKEMIAFFDGQFEKLKDSNHFSIIENFLCSLNLWSWKYLFDMPDEIFQLGYTFLSSLIDIWRKKCNEKLKTEIIKFCRLQISLHHPNHRKNIFQTYDDVWTKNLRDINDLILREIDEICHKQRLTNRLNTNEFQIRSDLLHLASSIFYQLSFDEDLFKNETIDDDLFEPSAKRTRYDHSTTISTNANVEMKQFRNLFQSVDPYHQAAAFQIVSLQLERNTPLTSTDCDYYMTVIKRYLTDEQRPSLLANALHCLRLLLTKTNQCQLTLDLVTLVQPLIHLSLCEQYVIEILSKNYLTFSNFYSCSSLTSLKYLYNSTISYSHDDENKLIHKLIPDLLCLYRYNEHDLSIFFSLYSPEYTQICSLILIQLCSLDKLRKDFNEIEKLKSVSNDFDRIEYQWSQLKLLIPIDKTVKEKSIEYDIDHRKNSYELNFHIFQRIIDIYEKNIRFIQQLKDKHLGERYKLILHFLFLGITILDVIQIYFTEKTHQNEQIQIFLDSIQLLFHELTDETNYFSTKCQDIPFVNTFIEHLNNSIVSSSDKYPSSIYYFLDAKFLSYLYNYSTQELFKRTSSQIEGVQCPVDYQNENDQINLIRTFEILVRLCFQALNDQEFVTNSFLYHLSINYQQNFKLLIRIHDEKLTVYLDELSLPDPISYRYIENYLSYLHVNKILRENDFDFICHLFLQLFRIYRRDVRLCQPILSLFELFLKNFYSIIQEKFHLNDNWLHMIKIIDAFWQMTINKTNLLNSQARSTIIRIKQIILNDETIDMDEMCTILNDSSYIVRIQAIQFSSNLFYEINNKYCLKSSNEQETIYQNLKTKTSSILLLTYLLNTSEYLSYRITFDLIECGMENKLSKSIVQHILPSISIRSIIQYWYKQEKYGLNEFPWNFLKINSYEQYNSFFFTIYFLSTSSNRQQLNSIFSDVKTSLIEYFSQVQSHVLPFLANQSEYTKQIENNRILIEKLLTKTEYNRLMKQKLTMIFFNLLLTYSNNDKNDRFYDRWAPEPIYPACNWSMLLNTFEYIRKTMNVKTLIELLLKLTDICEILLSVSSILLKTESLHEQLRLLHTFSLFTNDILLNSLDNNIYLHSILRDATYILLRYIEKNCQMTHSQQYQCELNEKIMDLICQLLCQLCQKGFNFQASIYLEHIPDIVSYLINYEKYLTRQRTQIILIDIYEFIKNQNQPLLIFISYAIEKLGYFTEISQTRTITTFHYLLCLSSKRLSLPFQWILEMFNNHLDNERVKSIETSINIDLSIVYSAKMKLLNCLKMKSLSILAGKCLAKCILFYENDYEENFDEYPYELIPLWIINDLFFIYFIDQNQNIVEYTRSTLKIVLNHRIGQDLIEKLAENQFIEIYSKPLLLQMNSSMKMQMNFPSSSTPWSIKCIDSFENWFRSLINYLIKQIEYYYFEKNENGHPYVFLFVQLKYLIQLKIDLGKKLFPYLIYCLLLIPKVYDMKEMLTKNFLYLIEQLNDDKVDENDRIHIEISQCIFRTINYLRQCPLDYFNRRNNVKNVYLNFENNFWLDIDYFQLAKCATKYQCYQSAIIYTDIWTTKQKSISMDNDYLTHLYYSDIDQFSSSNLIDLFVRIHSNMNQADEFYGLEKNFQNYPNLYGKFNELNNNYYDSLFYYDQAQTFSLGNSTKLIQSLRLCGFNHVLEQYLNQISSVSDDIFYRIQLTSILNENRKLTEWKIDEESSNCVRKQLLSIIQRQTRISSSILPQINNQKLWSNVSNLRECSLVNVIDDLVERNQNLEFLSKIWTKNEIKLELFDCYDEILLTRVALTNTLLLSNNNNKQILLSDLIRQLCQNALNSKKFQLCDRYLSDLSHLIDAKHSYELLFLRAKVLVLRQQDTAGEYLRQLISSSTLPNSIEISCRLLLCHWLNQTRCETSSTIKQQIDSISNSIKTLDVSTSIPLIFESYLAMAHFSDNEYQRLNQLFHSPMFENKRSLIARNQIEYTKQDKLDPTGRYTKVLKRSLDMDKNEIEEQKKLQYNYLISTLNNYLTCLKLYSNISKHQTIKSMNLIEIIENNSVPEIMLTSKCLSYWFLNVNNDEVNKTFKKNLSHIPTYFFLPFVYQMAARMALTNEKLSSFHSILLECLSRCVIDHPYHVLPVIFALVNAHKDAHINQRTKSVNNTMEMITLNNDISNDSRSRAAQYLLDECMKVKSDLVDQMRKLNDAYIEAAYWDVSSTKIDQQGKDSNGKNLIFSKQLRLMRIKDFDKVVVPTINLPISNDGNYQNIETVKYFNSEYAMVGGVNAPKKILCHSSTGRQLPQLLKGKDDLRQDAVMQQLFTVVNRLLEKDDLTCHRSLNIRTYKVVPLTQKSGVLEWCDGTITFGDYLTKVPDGAHPRYYPDDWTAMDCRRHIHKVTNSSKDERKRAFIHVCSKLRPVFRYFFYEYFNQPHLWHKKKQAYAKSVATSSIIGYIVGLGDRHVQNILIDTQSAEVIHIDLGVAFDQGKMLPIPEMIPFRLTRDIIDGLGICGTEGLFKKSCEITLELMRRYADTLITIIEVFLYDPLYQWQLSPQKALQLQQQYDKTNSDAVTQSSSTVSGELMITDTNKMAERLLLGVRQKLQGVERLNQMTIKAHVNMLIQEATNIDNLSQLFAGWQPYL